MASSLGLALNGVNFKDLFVSLTGKAYPSLQAAQAAGAPTINYGTSLPLAQGVSFDVEG